MRPNYLFGAISLVLTATAVMVPTPDAPPETIQHYVGGVILDWKQRVESQVKRLLGLFIRDELVYHGDYSSYGSVSPAPGAFNCISVLRELIFTLLMDDIWHRRD